MDVGETINGYRVLSKIGQGGMGTVHRASAPSGEVVALKTIHPHLLTTETRRRLTREIETMSKVRHPNVARIIDGDGQAPTPFIVTEFIEGPTLTARIRKQGPLNPLTLARLARGLGNALASMHHEDVVHRDLKPGNVMMRGDEPCIIDFGIAHVTDGTRITQTGSVMGTPGYTPPEVLDGADLGINCDWWAWAVTVIFAATGREPFGDTRRLDALWGRILKGKYDLTGVPDELYPQLAASLNPDPTKRPHASELQVAINELERNALAGTVTYYHPAAATGAGAAAPAPGSAAAGSPAAPATPGVSASPNPAGPPPAVPPATPGGPSPVPGSAGAVGAVGAAAPQTTPAGLSTADPAQSISPGELGAGSPAAHGAPASGQSGAASPGEAHNLVGVAGPPAGVSAVSRQGFLDVNEERQAQEPRLSQHAENIQENGLDWLAKTLLAPGRAAWLGLCALAVIVIGGLIPLVAAQAIMIWVAAANIVGLSAAALDRKRQQGQNVGAMDVAGMTISLLWRIPQGIILSGPAWVIGLLSFLTCGVTAHLILEQGSLSTAAPFGLKAQLAAVFGTIGWVAASWIGYGGERVRFGTRALATALTPSKKFAFATAALLLLFIAAAWMVATSGREFPMWRPWWEAPWLTILKTFKIL